MDRKTYRIIVTGAALAFGLAFTGPLAAHDCDEEDNKSAVNLKFWEKDKDRDRQAGNQTSRDRVVYADQNRDGRVTKREAKVDQALVRSFDRYDRNDDEILDRAEFAQLEASARPATDSRDRWDDEDELEGMDHAVRSDTEETMRPRHVVHPAPQ